MECTVAEGYEKLTAYVAAILLNMNVQSVFPDWPLQGRVSALTTLRTGGCSRPPYEELNLALHVGDQPQHVALNRETLRRQLRLAHEPKWLQQVHGDTVVNAAAITPDTVNADGAYTTEPGIVCAVLTADCLPIVFADKNGSCVGVAHVGWRGLLKGIIQRTIQAMTVCSKPDCAWLGPAIGPEAFAVGSDVYELYEQHNPALLQAFDSRENSKWNLDMYKAAKIVLAAADILNVYGGDYCTYTDRERFYSYRCSGRTGRMATLIWIK